MSKNKVKNFASYSGNGKGDNVIVITIHDGCGAKIESFKFNSKDKRTINNILNTINTKYDCKLEYKKNNSDIEWLKNSGLF